MHQKIMMSSESWKEYAHELVGLVILTYKKVERYAQR